MEKNKKTETKQRYSAQDSFIDLSLLHNFVFSTKASAWR